jgi:hypothetical protein
VSKVPYNGPKDDTLPAYVQKLDEKKRAQWVAIFNSAYKRCMDSDGGGKECESSAFAQANGVVIKNQSSEEDGTLTIEEDTIQAADTTVMVKGKPVVVKSTVKEDKPEPTNPAPSAAPPPDIAQNAEAKIESGDIVSWGLPQQYGKVLSFHPGKVPGVEQKVTGTPHDPAVKIQRVKISPAGELKFSPLVEGKLLSTLSKVGLMNVAASEGEEEILVMMVDPEVNEDPEEESKESPEEEDAEIDEGDFVTWDTDEDDDTDGIGEVVSVHDDGLVPDVDNADDEVEGTPDEPAARVRVYALDDNNTISPTDTYFALYLDDLEKLDEAGDDDGEEFSSPTPSDVSVPGVVALWWGKPGKTEKLTINKKVKRRAKKHEEPQVEDKPKGKARTLSQAFLTKLRDILKGKVGQEEFDTAVKQARAHAGGKAKAQNRAAENVEQQAVTTIEMAEKNISDKPWAQVDKTDLRNKLLDRLNNGDTGAEAAIRECYAVTTDKNLKDAPSSNWLLPHHELDGNSLVLNRNGVHAAYGALQGARGSMAITPDQKHTAARHLLKEYRNMGDNVPPELAKLAASESDDLYSHDFEYSLFMEVKGFAEATTGEGDAPEWIPILPKPHEYKHPVYGDIKITRARNEQFINNFQNAVYQDELPLDAEHETKLSGAYAWITDMRMNQDDSVDARVRWTPRGKDLVRRGGFRYVSPEWYDKWEDPGTGVVHNDVLVGGALTKRPFFKAPYLRPLVATEQGLMTVEGEFLQDALISNDTDNPVVEDRGEIQMSEITKDQFDALQATVSKLSESLDDANKTITALQQKNDALAATEQKFSEVNETLGKVQGVIAGLEQERDTAKAASETLAATVTEQVKTVEELKVAKEAAEKFSESQAKMLEEATSHINTMKASERRQRFSDEVLGRGENKVAWYGDVAANVAMLEKLADKFGEEDETFVSYMTNQRALAAQVQQSDLFKEVGNSRDIVPANTASGRFDEAVRKYMSESGKNEDEAYAHIALTEDKLYTEYTQELRTRRP